MLYSQNNSFNLKTINNIKLSALILFIVPLMGIPLNLIRLQSLTSLFEAFASFYFAYSIYIFALDQNDALKPEPMRIAIAFLFLGIFQFIEIFVSTNTSINTAAINNQTTLNAAIQSLNTAVFPAIIMLVLVSVAMLLGFIWFTQLFNSVSKMYNLPESNNLKHAAILQATGNALIIISLIILTSLVNQIANTGTTQSSLGTLSLAVILTLIGALLIFAALIVQLVAWYKVYKRAGEIEVFIRQPFINMPSKISASPIGTTTQPSYIQNTSIPSETAHLPNTNVQTQNENLSKSSQSIFEKPVFCSNCGAKLRDDSKYCTSCGQQIL